MPQEPEKRSWATSPLVVGAVSATLFGAILSGGLVGAAVVLRGGDAAPAPTNAGLKELLPAEKQATVSQYFLDYALVAETGNIETVEEAYDVYSRSIKVLKNAKRWVGSQPEFDEAVAKHLEEELGKSGPIDKDKLASAFRAVGEELK